MVASMSMLECLELERMTTRSVSTAQVTMLTDANANHCIGFIINANHGFIDGKSLCALLRDILSALSSNLQHRTSLQLPAVLGPKLPACCADPRFLQLPGPAASAADIWQGSTMNNSASTMHFRVELHVLSRIKAACRKAGVAFTALLVGTLQLVSARRYFARNSTAND